MKRLKIRPRNVTFSSIGKTFDEGPFWSNAMQLRERIGDDFESLSAKAFKGNGVVFTTMLVRLATLGEARFQFQRMENGRPGELHNEGGSLSLLEAPWPNGTTGELIARMDQDHSLAGNFFATKVDDGAGLRLRRLRPDWVTIVTLIPQEHGSPWDLDARVGGYIYHVPGRDPVLLPVDRTVHWSHIPDPTAQWRGMSWISAVSDEIAADNATTRHKQKYFENGASSNLIITYDQSLGKDTVKAYSEFFAEQYSGSDKAYKTIHLGGGADPKTVGADMKQLDFKVTQGTNETRIAAASLVGAVVAQLSEGMQGSSLNAGNFGTSMRRFADIGARPLWRSMAGALAPIVDVPDDSRLWYDDRDIPFLQDDQKDAAEIQSKQAATIRQLTDAGYESQSVVDAVQAEDWSLLEHTNLFSVQLQRPEPEQSEES